MQSGDQSAPQRCHLYLRPPFAQQHVLERKVAVSHADRVQVLHGHHDLRRRFFHRAGEGRRDGKRGEFHKQACQASSAETHVDNGNTRKQGIGKLYAGVGVALCGGTSGKPTVKAILLSERLLTSTNTWHIQEAFSR